MPDTLPTTPPATVALGDPTLTAGIPGEGPLKASEIKAWISQSANLGPLNPVLPAGLDVGRIPPEVLQKNPLSRAKIELGRQLYFDPRLSADGTVSCATCHDPDEGYAKHTQFGIGIRGQQGGRNSPVSYNRILSLNQFWDGRAGSLEEQAIGPIANPIEMGNTHEAAVEALGKIEGYRLQFVAIYGPAGLTIENVGNAIAAFERVIVTGPSPVDYFEKFLPLKDLTQEDLDEDAELAKKYAEAKAGAEAHPLSESALRGRELFYAEKSTCSRCHATANLTDEKYHNLGIGMDAAEPDLGRYNVTKQDEDKGAFKTPTIRNVALSAPYMHDGSLKTLLEVVEHYDKGGTPNPTLSKNIRKLGLTEQEKRDLVAFMEACTGDFPKVCRDRLPE
ncbi:MAG: c-type cytochrome [Planctomycetes bacterium]|nr:c-type cytochrome [Planctomycetota bacterium]